MVRATLIRELALDPPPGPLGEVRHLSAASGMVVAGNWIYIVADDQLHLAVFDIDGRAGGQLIRLLPGELPDEPVARKSEKPDLEALVRLPPLAGHPNGALLALASGSKPKRRTGALLGLDSHGRIGSMPAAVDLSGIYLPLQRLFPALNIEGAVVIGSELVLLHRGNKTHPSNALISYRLHDFADCLVPASLPLQPTRVDRIDLGTVQGTTLSLTDGAGLPDGRIVFSAVAEDTKDSYLDGPCLGAAIGIIGTDRRVQALHHLEPTEKIEGIHAAVKGDRISLLMVTDADDASVPGKLLGAEIPC